MRSSNCSKCRQKTPALLQKISTLLPSGRQVGCLGMRVGKVQPGAQAIAPEAMARHSLVCALLDGVEEREAALDARLYRWAHSAEADGAV